MASFRLASEPVRHRWIRGVRVLGARVGVGYTEVEVDVSVPGRRDVQRVSLFDPYAQALGLEAQRLAAHGIAVRVPEHGAAVLSVCADLRARITRADGSGGPALTAAELVISGPARVKKNSPRLVRTGRKCTLCKLGTGAIHRLPSEAHEEWSSAALLEVRAQWLEQADRLSASIPRTRTAFGARALAGPLGISMLVRWTGKGNNRRPDMDGVLSSVWDVLERAGVVENDAAFCEIGHVGMMRDDDRPEVQVVIYRLAD